MPRFFAARGKRSDNQRLTKAKPCSLFLTYGRFRYR